MVLYTPLVGFIFALWGLHNCVLKITYMQDMDAKLPSAYPLGLETMNLNTVLLEF